MPSSLRATVSCFDRFFFCKQKTAYEMRSRDWSSVVCSSDLSFPALPIPFRRRWKRPDALRVAAGALSHDEIVTRHSVGMRQDYSILRCDMADTESQPRRRANMPLPLPREVALLLQGCGAPGPFPIGRGSCRGRVGQYG